MVHWFFINAGVLAVLVTAGVAIFLVCCLKCSDCSSPEKDEFFHHHES
jgi:hypothetical protein